ncbi:uracil-DNA glycosylase [Natranaerofaba carboxydovora]|uniref:uracil-DNA glycosylase n=1 Tax=Natranaerofaba carboxydovora TaxID=2742683 RepID=UPI001F12FCEE|nr:uracil-DNA glycosylase [Natranaerofaba carboxydovora]UMZ74520.1 Uracil DNA glycosylase superfamily protein [Natranaerofaba carboxydovora]
MNFNNSYESLEELKEEALKCNVCHLREGCKGVVFGEGDPKADVMFVGEGPGAREDELQRPFVGRAGQLLTDMISSIDFKREDVYITNAVKCRPPNNRTPTLKEMETCLPILRQQFRLIKPKILVLLGSAALKGLLDPKAKITKVRGIWHEKKDIPIMPTYHPAFLLRNPPKKKESWEDLQEIKRLYDKLSSGEEF